MSNFPFWSKKRESHSKRGLDMLKTRDVYALTNRLDKVADRIETNWHRSDMTRKQAYRLCYRLDKIADTLENLAGEDSEVVEEQQTEAVTLEQEPDEPYMDNYDSAGTMDNTQDPDEPYMDLYDDDTDNEFDVPMEGETGEELQGRPTRASSSNWYEESKTSSNSNWYEKGKRSSSGSNWYE